MFGFRGQVPLGGRTALSTDDAAVVAAALVALDGWAAEVRLIPPTLDVGVDTDLVRLIPSSSGTDDHGRAEQPTRWILFTSGTTGEPKTISHTTASLTRTTVAGAGGDFVWGLFPMTPTEWRVYKCCSRDCAAGRPSSLPHRTGRWPIGPER